MAWIYVLIIVLIIAIIVTIISEMTVSLRFYISNKKIRFSTTIYLLEKVKIYKRRNSYDNDTSKKKDLRIDKAVQIVKKSAETVIRYNQFLRKINEKLGKGIKANKTGLYIMVGTGDAASTAIACGAIWAILGSFRVQKDYYSFFEEADFGVRPNYQKKNFSIEFESIFVVKTVYIIYVIICIRKLMKEAEREMRKENIK